MNTYELLAKEEHLLDLAEQLLTAAVVGVGPDAADAATEALAVIALAAELRIRREAS